ncbi:MAG: hypothetical protein JST04_09185 [Bdellovibrionales bacterium]|nr:hypothetical protein [Bdellovibrionales bacterium]
MNPVQSTLLETNFYHFFSGATMMAAWVCGLLFMRFWRRTADRFFLLFGLAFWTMSVERACLIFIDPKIEDREPVVYLIRLSAFLLILGAIWEKNRPARKALPGKEG